MRILVVNPSYPPVPYATGLQVHNWSNIQALQSLGHQIYLVMLLRSGDDKDSCIKASFAAIPKLKMCATIKIPELDYASLSSLNLRLILEQFFRPFIKREEYFVNGAHQVSAELQILLNKTKAELVWYEDFWVAVFDKWLKRNVPAVYNSHDHQARLFFQKHLEKPARNGSFFQLRLGARIRWLIYWSRYSVLRKIEQDAQTRCQVVLTGNAHDAKYYRSRGVKAMTRRVPIVGPPENKLLERNEYIDKGLMFKMPLKILHIGALNGSFTSISLSWFLDNVWPEFLKQLGDLSVELHIIGSGRPSEELSKKFSRSSIKYRGYVADIWHEFVNAFAMVVPGRLGTGIRIRVPVAFSMKIPAMGNSISFEGMPDMQEGKTVFYVESAEDYARIIKQLIKDKVYYRSVCESVFELYGKHFCISSATEDIKKAIEMSQINL